jgi:hypothetical protein
VRRTPDHYATRLDLSREFQQVTPIVRLVQGRPPLCTGHTERRYVAGTAAGKECGAGCWTQVVDWHAVLEWWCAGAVLKLFAFLCTSAAQQEHVTLTRRNQHRAPHGKRGPFAVHWNPFNSWAVCLQQIAHSSDVCLLCAGSAAGAELPHAQPEHVEQAAVWHAP